MKFPWESLGYLGLQKESGSCNLPTMHPCCSKSHALGTIQAGPRRERSQSFPHFTAAGQIQNESNWTLEAMFFPIFSKNYKDLNWLLYYIVFQKNSKIKFTWQILESKFLLF